MNPTRNFDHALTASSATRAEPAKRETAKLCREHAANALLQSVAMITAHQKVRFETSAASWTARAAMLQRVEDGIARKSADAAAAKSAIGDEAGDEPTRL